MKKPLMPKATAVWLIDNTIIGNKAGAKSKETSGITVGPY